MFSSQMLSSSRGKAFNFTFTFHIVKEVRLEFSTFLNSLLYFLDPVRPPSAPPWLLFAIQGVHQQAPGNSSAVGMGSCLEPSGRNTTPALRCPPRLFRTSASQADSYLPGQEREPCVSSWPGKYESAWDALVKKSRRRHLSAAVALFGSHHHLQKS